MSQRATGLRAVMAMGGVKVDRSSQRWLVVIVGVLALVAAVMPASVQAAEPTSVAPQAVTTPQEDPPPAPSIAAWGQAPTGNGSGAVSAVPVAVTKSGPLAGQTIVAVDAGRTTSCAVTANGRVACWGTGLLGDGTANPSNTPVGVKNTGALAGKQVADVAVGDGFACAVTAMGEVFCWGRNTYGQLGDGTTTDRLEPVAVAGLGVAAMGTGPTGEVASLTAGTDHACVGFYVTDALCWGRNDRGQLGIGVVGGQRNTPQRVAKPPAFSEAVYLFLAAGDKHTCATTFLPWYGVACWGDNTYGQLAQRSLTPAQSATPLRASLEPEYPAITAMRITSGDRHTCILSSPAWGAPFDGRMFCWGGNSHGQLGMGVGGPGSYSDRPVLVALNNLGAATLQMISAGQAHTCAMTSTGRAFCWGSQFWGSVGDGVLGGSIWDYPTLFVPLPTAVDTGGPLAGRQVIQIAAGGNRSIALYGPATTPGAPYGVTARAGHGQIWVQFPPLISDGGSPVTNYQYSLNGGAWQTFAPAQTMSPLLINGVANGAAYQVRLRARNAIGAGAASMPTEPVTPYADQPAVFVPATPARVYDSRTAGAGGTPAPLLPGDTRDVTTTGPAPIDAEAVVYNITVPTPAVSGHLRVLQPNTSYTMTSAVNFVAGETIANSLVVRTARTGFFRVTNGAGAPVNFTVDVVGYYVSEGLWGPGTGNLFTAIPPARAYDSRGTAEGGIPAGMSRLVSLAGQVPAGATAVAYNVTVPDTSGAGHLRVMPGNVGSTPTSTVNWARAGDVMAHGSIVGLDGNRRIRIYNGSGAGAHVIVDVVGYFMPSSTGVGARFHPIEPARAFDTRLSPGGAYPAAPVLTRSISDALTADGRVAAHDVVPAGATAVAVNATATRTAGRGHLRLFPPGTGVPPASSLNWPAAGTTRANGTSVGVSDTATLSVYFSPTANTHVVVDTVGYFR